MATRTLKLKVSDDNKLVVRTINGQTINSITWGGSSTPIGGVFLDPCNITLHTYHCTSNINTSIKRGQVYTGTCTADDGYTITNYLWDDALNVVYTTYKFDDGYINYNPNTSTLEISCSEDSGDVYLYALRTKPQVTISSNYASSVSDVKVYSNIYDSTPSNEDYSVEYRIYPSSGYVLNSLSNSNVVGASGASIKSVVNNGANGWNNARQDRPDLYYDYYMQYSALDFTPSPLQNIKQCSIYSHTINLTMMPVPNLKGTTWTFNKGVTELEKYIWRFANSTSTPSVERTTFSYSITYDGNTASSLTIEAPNSGNMVLYLKYGDNISFEYNSITWPSSSSPYMWYLTKTITFSNSVDIYDNLLYEFLRLTATQN